MPATYLAESSSQRPNGSPLEMPLPVSFTGIVVSYNEAQRLCDCLKSLSFCDQLIVIDIGSADASVEIAREYGAKVFTHQWVPVVEQVWPFAVSLARNEWIVRLDPDEVFPNALFHDVVQAIQKDDTLAVVKLPHQYYFRGKPLTTTKWGGIKYIGRIFHKDRVELTSQVHRGMKVKPGYYLATIGETPNNVVQHYWVDSYGQLFEKHWRYIKQEGEARYSAGERFSWVRGIDETVRALAVNLIRRKGIFGGLTGIFLSFFFAWYLGMSQLSLLKYQRQTFGKASKC